MNIIIDKRCIVAKTNSDKEVIKILFNAGLVTGAYLIWTDDTNGEYQEFPDGYKFILEDKDIDYSPTAFIILNEDIVIDNPVGREERAKMKIEKDIKKVEEVKQEQVSELFGFLK